MSDDLDTSGSVQTRVDFSRNVPSDADADLISAVEAEVRAHLSAVVDTDDNPETHAANVQLERLDDRDEIQIHGWIDQAPNAPYLKPGWSPDDEAAANPLSCPSIDDDPSVLHAELREED